MLWQLTCEFFFQASPFLRCQKCSMPFSIFLQCCQKMLKETKFVNLIHASIKPWYVMYCTIFFDNVHLQCSLTCLPDSCRILTWCLVHPLSGCGASIILTLFSNLSKSLNGGHQEWPSEYQDFAIVPVVPSPTNSTIRYMVFLFFFVLQQPRAPWCWKTFFNFSCSCMNIFN